MCALIVIIVVHFCILPVVCYVNGSNTNLWAQKRQNTFNHGTEIINNNGQIVESEEAVVAADDARCSEVGVEMLRLGGHAVDAAVATALCLGVVNPLASGIGGGAFMVVRPSSTSQAKAFDMRETAPMAASEV